jgi:hypothetical protein
VIRTHTLQLASRWKAGYRGCGAAPVRLSGAPLLDTGRAAEDIQGGGVG